MKEVRIHHLLGGTNPPKVVFESGGVIGVEDAEKLHGSRKEACLFGWNLRMLEAAQKIREADTFKRLADEIKS